MSPPSHLGANGLRRQAARSIGTQTVFFEVETEWLKMASSFVNAGNQQDMPQTLTTENSRNEFDPGRGFQTPSLQNWLHRLRSATSLDSTKLTSRPVELIQVVWQPNW